MVEVERQPGTPPAGGVWFSEPWRNRPFRGVTLHAIHRSAYATQGVYIDVILARCQSLTISDIRPLALKFHMTHGTACRSRALQLERSMVVQYTHTPPLLGFDNAEKETVIRLHNPRFQLRVVMLLSHYNQLCYLRPCFQS